MSDLTGNVPMKGAMTGSVTAVYGKDGKDGISPKVHATRRPEMGYTVLEIFNDGAEIPELTYVHDGNPGVYVGETEPTDPTVSVWVNPNGDETENVAYYHTKRNKIDDWSVRHSTITTDTIYDLFLELGEEYPGMVQKNTLGTVKYDGKDYDICEFVISAGEHNIAKTDDALGKGYYTNLFTNDGHIKKPKYLILSCIHGRERKTALSLYYFVRDILSGHSALKGLREGAVIHVLPVANPYAFDEYLRWNKNRVDINRNFGDEDGAWTKVGYNTDQDKNTGEDLIGDGKKYECFNGESGASETETKTIIKWLNDNNDAELFIDWHNLSMTSELTSLFGAPDNDVVDEAKKIALRGIDRVIPFWRDVIKFPPVYDNYVNEDGHLAYGKRPTIFSYSITGNDDLKNAAFYYAANTLGITALALETATYIGNYNEWSDTEAAGDFSNAYQPKAIAVGAETIGNILIEFYEQAFFGEVSEDMKQIDSKLDTLAKSMASISRGFRVESGVLNSNSADSAGNKYISDYVVDGVVSGTTIVFPCSANPKMIILRATEATQTTLATLVKNNNWAEGKNPAFAIVINNIVDMDVGSSAKKQQRNALFFQLMKYGSSSTMPTYSDAKFYNIDTIPQTIVGTFYNGADAEYEWTAYYWND